MLSDWARKWSIPQEALRELVAEHVATGHPLPGKSEAAVQAQIRLDACDRGWRLWRNNTGVLLNDRGVPVRFGLCNDSKNVNANMKSADLIGIRPVVIQATDIGRTIGQFAAVEVKEGDWVPGSDDREHAQAAFLRLVRDRGGYGIFSTGKLP